VDRAKQCFGRNVLAARRSRGWTQEDLAGETGLAVVQISRIERGVREVRLTTVLRLLAAFDGPVDELIDPALIDAVR
jgi:transcriptional regulator with XRE-family HTH domain